MSAVRETSKPFTHTKPAFGVSVVAPARLHLGFIDLSGSRGRRFGSVGLTISELETQVTAQAANLNSLNSVSGSQLSINHRAMDYLHALQAAGCLPQAVALQVEQRAPEHAGFGSGTQLALAVARAVKELFALPHSLAELAHKLARGARSGVGVAAFEQGGFLVDGGHAVDEAGKTLDDTPPPLLSRMAFPEQWRVLLILDTQHKGLHGDAERAAFAALPGFARADAERLAHAVLMQALPALAEENLSAFGAAITELQQVVGDYFAPAQGGRYASVAVAAVLGELAKTGVAGYGQSSWGPTGFALFASAQEAEQQRAALTTLHPQLQFQIVSGRNSGALVMRMPLTAEMMACNAPQELETM
jgi:beta-ribofuranosylaminobenzene 5'-phosphate synthase